MSRTIRRRKYVAPGVDTDLADIPGSDGRTWTWYRLEGAALANALRAWHSEKPNWRCRKVPGHWCHRFEVQHRIAAKAELHRWLRDEEYEVQLRSKPSMEYY